MKVAVFSLLMVVAPGVSLLESQRHPSCIIIDYTEDEQSGTHHAQHKCKAKDGSFKCSDITLDDCVAVNNKDGSLFVRGYVVHFLVNSSQRGPGSVALANHRVEPASMRTTRLSQPTASTVRTTVTPCLSTASVAAVIDLMFITLAVLS